jgi:hypothetical protein
MLEEIRTWLYCPLWEISEYKQLQKGQYNQVPIGTGRIG